MNFRHLLGCDTIVWIRISKKLLPWSAARPHKLYIWDYHPELNEQRNIPYQIVKHDWRYSLFACHGTNEGYMLIKTLLKRLDSVFETQLDGDANNAFMCRRGHNF